MKKGLQTISVIAFYVYLSSQLSFAKSIEIKLSQNATSFPLLGLSSIVKPGLHPGLMFCYETPLNNNVKHQFFNEISLGCFYHQLFQTAAYLNNVVKYNYAITPRWSIYTGIGGGYLHSFYQYSIFKLNENQDYEEIKKWKGRPQLMGTFALGASYGLKKENPDDFRISIELRSFVHGTFARSYVPLLPYNSLQIGFKIKLKTKNNNSTILK
jgi:hypothetical protein